MARTRHAASLSRCAALAVLILGTSHWVSAQERRVPVRTVPTRAVPTRPVPARPVPARVCENSVQDRVAWNDSGNKHWTAANLARLCRGATDSAEPGRCFERLMHGGISWGGGTQWQWRNALDLCEGTVNAAGTIDCFQGKIREGESWRAAIQGCTGLHLVTQEVATASTRTILVNGTVEVTYPDGSRIHYYAGGETRFTPDGTATILSYSTGARPPIPPSAPDSSEAAWLERHSEEMLLLIQVLVQQDQATLDNYLQFEGADAGIYEKITKRAQTLGLLLRE